MKYFSSLALIMLVATTFVQAQFTGDPNHPLPVCNAASTQKTVTAFSDGKGGTYSFWIDERANLNGVSDIYGQHLTTDGNRLWETNGRLIISGNGNGINDFRCTPWQSGLLISWEHSTSSSGDSLFCQYLDTAGVPLWSKPTLIAHTNHKSIIHVETDGFNVFPNSLGATIGYAITISGGYGYFSFNRIDFSGKLRWAIDSFLITSGGYYDYRSCGDGLGGLFVMFKGNGTGSSMAIQRYDTSGAPVLSSPVVFTPVGGGFNGNINMHNDAAGNLYITWDDFTHHAMATKISKYGTFAWLPAYHNLSNFTSNQTQSYSILNGSKLYTIWSDDRASTANSLVCIQKTDTSGVNEWTPGGVKVCELNLYSANPQLTLSDSSSITATYETIGLNTIPAGFYGQKIRPDSSFKFPVNGKLFVNENLVPFYADYTLVDNGDGCTVAVWSTTSGDIYATNICTEIATGVKSENAENGFNLFPNPSSSIINWTIPTGELANNLTITDLSGRQIYNQIIHASTGTIDISKLSKGMYILQSVSGKAVYSRKLIIE